MMSTLLRVPFLSSKSKAKRNHKEKNEVVQSTNKQDQVQRAQDCERNSLHENPRSDRSKRNKAQAKLLRRSTLPIVTETNIPPDALPHQQENKTADNIGRYLSRHLSYPQARKKPVSSRTLPVPEIPRQNSFEEAHYSSPRAKPQIEKQKSNASISDDKNYPCVVDFPYDNDIVASCHLLSKPPSPPIRTSGTVVTDKSYKMNNNYGNTRGHKYLKVKLANIRTIPPSGKIDITIELPSPVTQFVRVASNASTVVQVTTPVVDSIWIVPKVVVTNASYDAPENLRSSSMDFLTVGEGFRPRASSDSRIDRRSLKPHSRAPNKKELPDKRINFSGGKTALRNKLEGQPDDLRLDLDNDAEFFAMLNSKRKSFECPEISRPSIP